MSIKERNNLPSTALPELDLQPGVPDTFLSVKLPRTNLDDEDIIVHRRVAIKQGGTLSVGGAYLSDLALLLEGALRNTKVLWIGVTIRILLFGCART